MKRPPEATLVTGSNKATGYWVPYVLPKGTRFAGRPSGWLISLVRNVPPWSVPWAPPIRTGHPQPPCSSLPSPCSTSRARVTCGGWWGRTTWRFTGSTPAPTSRSTSGRARCSPSTTARTRPAPALTVSCQGAMLQLDNFLSKPAYPYQPLPYELEIANQFKGRPSLRLGGMFTEWPSWWTKMYDKTYWDNQALYRRPQGMSNGQRWTGLLTRNTGDFEPGSAAHRQPARVDVHPPGQWTMMLDKGRRPVLRHRDRVEIPICGTLGWTCCIRA